MFLPFSSEKALCLTAHAQSISSKPLMRPLIFALWIVFAGGGLRAQTPTWQPSPEHTQAPVWPGTVPDPQPVDGPEFVTNAPPSLLVAGRPWVSVGNVSQPTMTVYSPKGTNTGIAVALYPGHLWNEKDFELNPTIPVISNPAHIYPAGGG